MLVITRNHGESITIRHGGEDLRISVTGGNGKRIKYLIDGPRSFDVSRGDKPKPKQSIEGSNCYARITGNHWKECVVERAYTNEGTLYLDVKDSTGVLHKGLLLSDVHEIKEVGEGEITSGVVSNG